jgi:hypothetical protein
VLLIAAGLLGCASTAVMAQAPAAPGAPAAPAAAPAAPVTPRLADGHPDLNGIWGGGVAQLTPTCGQKQVDAFGAQIFGPANLAGANERLTAGGAKGGQQWITFEQDCGPTHRAHMAQPQYKPQYWQSVRDHDRYANAGGDKVQFADPSWRDYPLGVPRMGPPNEIVQLGNKLTFLYETNNIFRSMPTDCREFDPVLKYDQSWMGLAVGCWKGDTLVVTSVGFTDQSWLDWPGYIHSNEMTVTETFERKGDQLLYQVTVVDPVMLVAPYVQPPVTLSLNKNPQTMLMQDLPYQDRSLGALTDGDYRG